MPEISVIIPTYNCAEYLSRAIDSVLSQSFQDFELLIIDDGSTDNTKQVVNRIKDINNSPIRYIYMTNTGSPVKPRNRGIYEAKGEYIAFLDHDDTWNSTKLRKQIGMFKTHSQLDLIFTDCSMRYSGSKVQKSFLATVSHFYGQIEISTFELLKGNFIYPSTVMIKKSCLKEGFLFNENLKIKGNEDYDLWLRFSERYRIGCFREILCERFFHGENLSRHIDNQFLGELEVLDAFLRRSSNQQLNSIAEKRIIRLYFGLGYFNYEAANKKASWRWFLMSMRSIKMATKALFYCFIQTIPNPLLRRIKKFKAQLLRNY